jgi:hypothetical protein
MTVTVTVQNLGSVPMEVQSLTINFDWYTNLAGDTPRILQAGERWTWNFANVEIPSYTWIGRHSYDVSVMVGWADSSGGWSNTLKSPAHASADFAVQSPPPPQPAVTINEPGYTQAIGPAGPSSQPSNGVDAETPAVIFVLCLIVVGVAWLGIERKEPIPSGMQQPS